MRRDAVLRPISPTWITINRDLIIRPFLSTFYLYGKGRGGIRLRLSLIGIEETGLRQGDNFRSRAQKIDSERKRETDEIAFSLSRYYDITFFFLMKILLRKI